MMLDFHVPVCEELHSIFDKLVGFGDSHLMIFRRRDDKELYAISQKNFEKFDKNGRRLKLDEIECFCGKRVIGISDEEILEEKYIMDIWGNACYAE